MKHLYVILLTSCITIPQSKCECTCLCPASLWSDPMPTIPAPSPFYFSPPLDGGTNFFLFNDRDTINLTH